MKSYTDLDQSKKLAEILPLESADMWWLYITAQGKYITMMHEEPDPHYLTRMESYGIKDAAIRCWSLAALLEILDYPQLSKDNLGSGKVGWMVSAYPYNCRYDSIWHDNPVNACVEMILKLHELNLL